ncbi:MAG: hypothetical protein RL672_768 [Actinomycetota bacterium]|jgi:hypothetical protein
MTNNAATNRNRKTSKADSLTMAIAAAPMTLEDKLGWHFAMLDKIPKSMLPVCAAAIRLHDAGFDEATTMLDLPAGATYFGKSRASIGDVISGHYLEFFLATFADCLPASPLAT